MKLLVAVSNDPLSRAIRGTLLGAGHEVESAGTSGAALDAIEDEAFDAVVLDEGLLGEPITQVIESLRDARPDIRILLLTSTPMSKATGEGNRWRALPDEYAPIEHAVPAVRGTATDDGLTSSPDDPSSADTSGTDAPGAGTNARETGQSSVRTSNHDDRLPDAVLRKPFSDTELLSYVAALAADSPELIIRGNLTLDTTNRRAYYASTHSPITLSRLEFSLLEALVRANGAFVNTRELVKLVGGPYFEQQGLLRNALYTLDQKLTRAGLIMTQRGSNWRIR